MMRCALFLGLLWLAGCGSGPQGPEQMKEAMNLSSYGHDSYSLGDYHVAGARFQKALRKSRAIDDQPAVARDLHNYGMVLMRGNLPGQAAAHFAESARLFGEQNMPLKRLESLLAEAEARFQGGDREGARRAIRECRREADAEQVADWPEQDRQRAQELAARAQASLGAILAFEGDLAAAEAEYEQAAALAEASENRGAAALVALNRGRLQARRGEHQKAIRHYTEARAAYHDMGDAKGVADTLSNWAASALALAEQSNDRQDTIDAAVMFRRAAHASRSIIRYDVAAWQLAQAGVLFAKAGDAFSARRARDEGIRMLEDFEVERFRNWPPGYEGDQDPDVLKEARRLGIAQPLEQEMVPHGVRRQTIHERLQNH